MKLIYEEINQSNIQTIIQIQKEIWKDFPDSSHFLECLNADDVNFKYYLVKNENGNEVGITGHYPELNGNSTIWLGWFGVLPHERSKGYGKQILLDTIQMCKKLDFPFFRAYTSELYDYTAQPLYNNIMQLKERYLNPNDETYQNSTLIFSYALKDLPLLAWDNKYIGIKEYEEKSKTIK